MASITQRSTPNRDRLGIRPVQISTKGTPDAAQRKANAAKTAPTVYYYGVELPRDYVKSLVVDCNKFLPLVYIKFRDTYNMLHDVGFPADNAKVTVVIPSGDDRLGPVFMDFKITKYEVELKRGQSRVVHFWGVLNVEGALIQQTKSWADTTSWDLMRQNASDCGLGFASNVESTQDRQTWINPAQEVHKFLQDATRSAWNGESSYMWSFVDQYYNLTYVDVEAALAQDISELTWHASNIVARTDGTAPDGRDSTPFLTNEPSLKATNFFFTGEKILNQSTDISLKRGYARQVMYYDKDGSWSKRAGTYKVHALDTITSPGGRAPQVILKGDPGSTDFYTKNEQNYWAGRIDTSNAHPDYLWARMQNSENLLDLQKVCMQVTLPQANFNIRRFEKLRLLFTTAQPPANGGQSNTKLNGEWLTTGFVLEWNGDALFQKVNLVKREITINDI